MVRLFCTGLTRWLVAGRSSVSRACVRVDGRLISSWTGEGSSAVLGAPGLAGVISASIVYTPSGVPKSGRG